MLHHVITLPNDHLRVKSRVLSDAEIASSEIQQLILEMKQTMKQENGVGLAAPQIDKQIRLIIAQTENGNEAFINPKIVGTSIRMLDSEEGCLSIPGVWGVVKRHRSVKVVAKNDKGENVEIEARGLLSIIFQHEIDHLDGILFIDRAHTLKEPSTIQGNVV